MRINRLQFKELTSAINSKELKLDILGPDSNLFDAKSPRLRMQEARGGQPSGQQASRDPRKFKNISYINSKKVDPDTKQDELFFLIKGMLSYLYLITPEERGAIGEEIEDVLHVVAGCGCLKALLSELRRIESQLSKRYKNRLVHLVFYILYSHLLGEEGTMVELQLKNARLTEYYSRKFNFRHLALSICMRMQILYMQKCDYIKSREYARKALKLAVVLGDSYQESRMIEALGKLNYYEGRLNAIQPEVLSEVERRRIIENYDEERQTDSHNIRRRGFFK